MKRPVVVFVVERGWQRSRELSLDLMHKGWQADILIKGFVEKPVLDMITKYPGIKITSVSRFWFRAVLFLKIAALKNLKAVYVEGKKIEKWLYIAGRCFGLKVFLVTNELYVRGGENYAKVKTLS